MGLTQQTDHVDAGLARLAEQFKNKARFRAFLTVFLQRIQNVEDALWSVYVGRFLANAVGVQLDTLGKIVGQLRGNSANDAEYRVRITARILCNRSNGTSPDIYAVFQALLPSVSLNLWNDFPAGFEFFINTPITFAYATLYAGFLGAAKAAGVMANLVWYLVDDPHSFFTESAPFTYSSAGVSAGGTSVVCVSSLAFPSTGTLRIDGGMPHEEVIAYTSRTGTTFTLGSALAYAHDAHTPVALSVSQGQGFAAQWTTLSGAALVADTTIAVNAWISQVGLSAPSYPVSAVIDEGSANEETISITGVAVGVASLGAPLAFAHESSAPVVLSIASPGGKMAGVIAA